MKRRRLIILRVLLALLLLLAVGVLSMQWWSASLANSIAQYLLSKTEHRETSVTIDEVGLGGSRISLDEFRLPGIEVRDAAIDVDYTPQHLWNLRVSEVSVVHPQVIVDLAHWLDFLQKEPEPAAAAQVPTSLKVPVNELALQDAQIQLVDGEWRQAFVADARASLGERSQLSLNVTGESELWALKAAGDIEQRSGDVRLEVVTRKLAHWIALSRRAGIAVPVLADQVQFDEATATASARLKNGQLGQWQMNGNVDDLQLEAPAVSAEVGQTEIAIRGIESVPSEMHISLKRIDLANDLANLSSRIFVLQSDGDDQLVATLHDWTAAMKQMDVSTKSGAVVATLQGPWTEVGQGWRAEEWGGKLVAGPAPFYVESGFGNFASELWIQAAIEPGAEERASSLAVRLKAPTIALPIAQLEAAEIALDVEAGIRGIEVHPREIMADILDAKLSALGMNFAVKNLFLDSSVDQTLALQSSAWEMTGQAPLKELGEISVNGGPMELKVLGPWTTLMDGWNAADWSLSLGAERAPFAFYSNLGSITGDLSFSAQGDVAERRVVSSIKLFDGDLNAAGASLHTPELGLLVQGDIGGQLTAGILLEAASANWSDGAGKLEGLSGWLYRVKLTPPSFFFPQTLTFEKFTQGKLEVEGGEMTLNRYAPVALGGDPRIDAAISANALGGKVFISIKGTVVEPRKLNIRVKLESVDLEALSVLLPKFDGSISGKVSGELGLQIIGNNKALIPGVLEMTTGTTGRFQFTKLGWMTQDPDLNPEEFVKDKDIVKLMQQPNAASIVTELAMRNLVMTKFRLEIFKPGAPMPAEINIEGSGSVKGVEIPVVLDVPIRGELLETLNFGLQLQSKM